MRRYGRRKFRGKRRRVYRSRGSKYIGRIARRTIRRMAETKYNITTVNSANINTVPGGYSFFDSIPVGTGSGNRIGNQIKAKSYGFNLNFNLTAPVDGSNQGIVRVVVVFPRKGISSAEMMSWMTTTLGTATLIDPTRFYVIFDRTFPMSSNSQGNGVSPSWRKIRMGKRANFVFNYMSNGLVDREPMLFFVSSVTLADQTDIFANGYIMTRFIDI